MHRPPELLLPAGSLDKMRYAFAYGADAVYAGLPRYSLRARNNDFRLESLATGIAEARAAGKKFFVTANLMAHNAKVRTYLDDIAPVVALQPDALIMADPGLIMLTRERWPDMPIHLSVQANTVNHASVRFWERVGVSRIILSRELSLDEITEIRQTCPDIELEVFVHGALCIAYSGRCLLSGYFNHRDANQGTCTNACRWEYSLHSQNTFMLEEKERPGELMPVEEDENGTYILNSKDLRAVEHVARLVEIGIDSLKVEGRTKSAYYVARTTQIYRRAIDDAIADRPFDNALLAELDGLANRGYTEGFFQRHTPQHHQNYASGLSQLGTHHYVGDILEWNRENNQALVEVKNRFSVGEALELITPQGNREFTLTSLWNEEGFPIETAPGAGHRVRLALRAPAPFGMLAKRLQK